MKELWENHVAVSQVVFDHSEPEQPNTYTTSVNTCSTVYIYIHHSLCCPLLYDTVLRVYVHGYGGILAVWHEQVHRELLFNISVGVSCDQ